MLLDSGDTASRLVLTMEDRLHLMTSATKEALPLVRPHPPPRDGQLSLSPPWETTRTTTGMSTTPPLLHQAKVLPERPEPVYPSMLGREMLSMKTDTLSPPHAHRDAGIIRTPFYPFPPLPPSAGTLFPLPLQMQHFAAGQLLPKYLPFSPFLFQAKYPLGKKTFRCQQCRYVTDRKNNLKRHIATMHQDCGKTLECCDIIFKSKAALRDHVLLFHRTGYKCRYCGRNFCRKALLKRHLAVHNGQKDFICSICDYATSHKSNLERHKKVHGQGSDLSGDEDDYIPEPEEMHIDVESDLEIEVGEETGPLTKTCVGSSALFDPMLESTAFHTGKRSACHKGKFSLPDRLRQTHEESGEKEEEREQEFVQGMEPETARQTKESPPRNGQMQRSSHLQGPSSKVKIGGHRRLFANPYKCSECTLSFAAQHQLALHAMCCMGDGEQVHLPVPLSGTSHPAGGPEAEPLISAPFSSSTSASSSSSLSASARHGETKAEDKRPSHLVNGTMSVVTLPIAGTVPSSPLKSADHPQQTTADHTKDTWNRGDKSASSSPRSLSPLSDDCNPRHLPLKKRCVNAVN